MMVASNQEVKVWNGHSPVGGAFGAGFDDGLQGIGLAEDAGEGNVGLNGVDDGNMLEDPRPPGAQERIEGFRQNVA